MEQTLSSRNVVPETRLSRAEQLQGYRNRHRQAIEAWMILIPIMLYYALFSLLPIVVNVLVSFTAWNGITAPEWVGLKNYIQLFTEPTYQQVFLNSAIFAVGGLALTMPLGLLVAIMLNQKIRGLGLYRALWYIPAVTSTAIMAQIMGVFISPYGGVFNNILKALEQPPVIWTIDAVAMRLLIIAFTVWRGLGTTMVLYLAALQAIPQDIYDAAAVDGAGTVAKFRYITVPSVRHMTFFVVITGIINGFQIFEPILLISQGGPFNQTNVVLNQIYNDAFKNSDFGLATASATILAIFLLGASILSRRVLHEGEES